MKVKKKIKAGKKNNTRPSLKKVVKPAPAAAAKVVEEEYKPMLLDSPEKKREELEKMKSSQIFVIASCAALGFIFCFLTAYGGLDLTKGLSYGMLGLAVGGVIGILPYKL